ncbi:SseB family protein [Pikeienuella sp. HZG-20]|uniref:SseB family protein n=1 Tax=Paludibacillus litoralis TaxID=3133267 RepID=UPI0030EBE232
MIETPLDRAWAAAEAPGAGDAEMAHYYEVFAAAEFFLAIDAESFEDAAPQPILFSVDGAETALIFDTESRMADFLESGAAHLALSGRAVLGMFAGRGVQLGVNLGEAPSATILPAEAVDWAAAATLQPVEAEASRRLALTPPQGLEPALFARIDAKLAGLAGNVVEAWLCGAGEGGLVLCLALRAEAAEAAVVAALAETARFAGGDRAAFDIAVLKADDPALSAARKIGLGFELAPPAAPPRAAPGMDPAHPPKLR